MNIDLNETRPQNVSQLLRDAEKAALQGERYNAYQSCLKATLLAPHDPMAWYVRAQTAPSLEEQLVCLSRVYSLKPDFLDGKGDMYAALSGLLKKEPALIYLDETENLYRIRSGLDLLLNVPKNRAHEKLFHRQEPGPLRTAYRWLNLAVLTLFLGGIGAFFLAPLVILQALILRGRPLSRPDQTRLLVLLVLSGLVWLLSIPLSLLFLVHFFA